MKNKIIKKIIAFILTILMIMLCFCTFAEATLDSFGGNDKGVSFAQAIINILLPAVRAVAAGVAIIGITVLSYVEKYVDAKTATFYTIEVKSHITQNTWQIEKRYSEFYSIHEKLSKLFPRLPQIPGKTFSRLTSEQGLNKRKEQLEIFLRDCVKRRDILQNSDFQNFLELDKNAPEVVGNTVTLVYDYKKCPLGVRDFIVIPHREIMCVCCSDMNIISRTNVTLTNFAFGKTKGDDCQIPMGAAFIYQCKPDPKEIYKIHKIWAKPFPKQTGVIHWEDKNEIFSIGLDDGRILSFKAVPNTHYLQMFSYG